MNCSLGGRLVRRLVSAPCNRRTITSTSIRWMTSPKATKTDKVGSKFESKDATKTANATNKKQSIPALKKQDESLIKTTGWLKLFRDAIIRKQEAADQKSLQLEAFALRKMPLLARIVPAKDTESTPKFGMLVMKKRYWAILAIIYVSFWGICVYWHAAIRLAREKQDLGALSFMIEHFSACYENLANGRWWTLFTSSFSHASELHFNMNMLGLIMIGPEAIALLGATRFIVLWLGASAISSLFYIGWQKVDAKYFHKDYHAKRREEVGTAFCLGASGSLYSIVTAMACLSPHTTFRLFFIVPMPAYVLISGVFIYDFVSALTRPGRQIGSAAHIGGIISGILFWRFGMKRARYASLSV